MTAGRPGFEVARRGYRASQVDAWVDEIVDRLRTAEHDRDDAVRLARTLQGALDDARTPDRPETFGVRADKILRMAEHDARLCRERAEREAAQIRELAHSEAERTVAEARAEAARLRGDAERAAGRVRDEAERSAERARTEVTTARRDADLCADTAAAMHEHVQSLRSAVRGEVARLHAALGAELRTLDAPVPAPTTAEPGTGDIARVVALPGQRERPSREQVSQGPIAAGD